MLELDGVNERRAHEGGTDQKNDNRRSLEVRADLSSPFITRAYARIVPGFQTTAVLETA